MTSHHWSAEYAEDVRADAGVQLAMSKPRKQFPQPSFRLTDIMGYQVITLLNP